MRTSGEAERVARLLGVWRGETPVSVPLRDALAELIDGSHLPAGWRMPGQRALTGALGVARGTVARAYTELTASGHLTATRGSGTYVRGAGGLARPEEGRLTSFGGGPVVVDLSSGALPGSELIADVMPEVAGQLREHHLHDTGYHPAGLPELRAALAARITGQGLPTRADQVLVTAGSQQAVWLIATALAGPGTSSVVEDPSYRGALQALVSAGGRVRGIPFTEAGVDLNLLEAAADADLLYVQTALHNPTGVHMPEAQRRALADIAARHGTLVVDDQSQAELGWFRSQPLPGLERMADPERLLIVGTLSKLFWGGLRVGWVRGPREIIGRLAALRGSIDLGGPIADQVAALHLLPQADRQRELRRAFLARQFAGTAEVLREVLPRWRWSTPVGGSGLWADTGQDAVALAQRALARGIRLTAGPAFSPHHGHRTRVRLPIWHPQGRLADAVRVIADLQETRWP
ncbi:PLP-dependent aminotransferase family protein [Streptomyces sp. 35G-GA-8]|uniref:aminotransferase-like domain-containing protein n=1 Tax=Streptomyces sp. 35G-GA-8 TaxID=2939434 RepID=UPI00201E963A|nr:PLP-dependent aminotransferase family protein [Streptomyces sp. 35G-GA-8]MCL7375298.1 PLP-dependent aminotransferase family protein [Streptomyces sp. 35G-GA-8]